MKVRYYIGLLLMFFGSLCNISYGCDPAKLKDEESKVVTYTYPRSIPASSEIKMTANNQPVTVYNTTAGSFAAFSCQGEVTIDIKLSKQYKKIYLSPEKTGFEIPVNGTSISFKIPGPKLFAVMADGMPLLYVYANPIDNKAPNPSAKNVKYFRAGQIYEVGQLRLNSNETLYIEGGAVVKGCIISTSAENVRIAGNGVLDGSYYNSNDDHRTILFEGCKKSIIEDIIIIEPTSWMIVLGASENIVVRNVKELGFVSTTDGVDVVGSKHIRIENCFFRNGDDCIVVKAMDMRRYDKTISLDFSKDVEDVEATGCILWSYGGYVFEIGHEITTDSINNIRYTDCDVIVHSYGGIFGIHNTDRATISNVLYENIRVEHYYNKLIELKIIKSRYYKDEIRGQGNNIVFRNIEVKVSQFNPGYTISCIGGYDAEHMIQNVVFDNFRMNGVKVLNTDQLDLYVKQALGITFK